MFNITEKVDNVTGTEGYLFANEFNAIAKEISNAVSYRQDLASNDNLQLLRSIVMESKFLFYKDNGTVNNINLERDGEINFDLKDNQTFLFTPFYANTGNVMIKVGSSSAMRLIKGTSELPAGYLSVDTVYMCTYDGLNNLMRIREFSGSGTTTSDDMDIYRRDSNFIEVTSDEIGTGLTDNDSVYIDQVTKKYEQAIIEYPASQKQNVIGIFKTFDNKGYVFFNGIVPNFAANMVVGMKYFLTSETAGAVNITADTTPITVGRALKNNAFLLNIEGNVNILDGSVPVSGYDTVVVDGSPDAGVSLVDPTGNGSVAFNSKTYDGSIPALVEFVSVAGVVYKIVYASEYENDPYDFVVDGTVYSSTFVENNDYNNPTPLDGSTVVTSFDTTLVDGESKEGNSLVDPSGTGTLAFNKKTYDGSVPALVEFIDINGTTFKIVFASEYTGDTYNFIVGTDTYVSSFAENEDYNNPTVVDILV